MKNTKRFGLLFLLLTLGTSMAFSTDLVEVQKLDPTIRVDLKYATADNFMKEVLYNDNRCFLRPSVAERLVKAQAILREQGYGIVCYDCYRPLAVQKKMFARFPQPGFVADPAKGSNHNRGAAIDAGLVDKDGNILPMPSEYDEFTGRAHSGYKDAPPELIQNREILRAAMEKAGFNLLKTEWWHFDDPDCKTFEVLDIPIEEL